MPSPDPAGRVPRHAPRRFPILILAGCLSALASPTLPRMALLAQETAAPPVNASANATAAAPNYRLAGRFAPYKIRDLIYSTQVEPNWIEGTESF